MYLIMARCDGPTAIDTPETRGCSAALSLTAYHPEDAGLAARNLAQQAEEAGWYHDERDEDPSPVLICSDCWPYWQELR